MEIIEEQFNYSISFDDIPFKMQREIIACNEEQILQTILLNKWMNKYPDAAHLDILDMQYKKLGGIYNVEAKIKYTIYPFFYN